jgi:hypothetical protein
VERVWLAAVRFDPGRRSAQVHKALAPDLPVHTGALATFGQTVPEALASGVPVVLRPPAGRSIWSTTNRPAR